MIQLEPVGENERGFDIPKDIFRFFPEKKSLISVVEDVGT